MIDNFYNISKLINWKDEDKLFCHLQILRRGKDHPDLPAANKLIKSWLVYSYDQLSALKEEIMFLCEHYKARAYINVTPKKLEKLNTLLLQKLAINVHNNNVINPMHLYNSACGELKGVEPRWIVDIDNMEDEKIVYQTIDKIWMETHSFTECQWMLAWIPTKSGVHYITKPFNLGKFKDVLPHIDVHKNNPTVLYIPDSLCND